MSLSSAKNSPEFWIWTELLAFDCTEPDFGVGAYLGRIGAAPHGITLLLSSIDLFLQNPGMEKECPLPPDVCSRFGHSGNEERQRQVWTNHALRGLVRELHRHSVKVFASFFIVAMHNRFHREYLSDHPELRMGDRVYGIDNAIDIVARLDDGTLFEDILAPAITRACLDYEFDGWHGADGQGPGWNLTHSDASDGFFLPFAESLPPGTIPPELLEPAGNSQERMNSRLDFVWENLHHQWADFTSRRWLRLWQRITEELHHIGKEVMINSPFAKSIFEGIYYFGLDYRKLPPLHIDYLLTESVTTSCSLLYGGYERMFDFSAMIAEMRAVLPKMKIIVMPGVKDVVESYDALRHAPMRLERDIFAACSQTCFNGQAEVRAADGCLICLGDGILPEEWQALRRFFRQSFSFETVRSGEAGWLVSAEAFGPMRSAYDRHGNWPPYQIPAQLCESEGLDISCAVPAQYIEKFHRPVIIPHFELLDSDLQQKILKRPELSVLFGNLREFPALPPRARTVCLTELDESCTFACVILNEPAQTATDTPAAISNPAKRTGEFPWNRPYFKFISTRIPRTEIPGEFWHAAGNAIRQELRGPDAEPPEEGFRKMEFHNAAGECLLALLSFRDIYLPAKVKLPLRPLVQKITGFPYSPLHVTAPEGILALQDHQQPLHLPPQGIVLALLTPQP